MGAAWLLFLEGSPSSLGAVAALAEDDSVPVRDLAGRASVLLSRLTWSGERHGRGGAAFGALFEPEEEPDDRAERRESQEEDGQTAIAMEDASSDQGGVGRSSGTDQPEP